MYTYMYMYTTKIMIFYAEKMPCTYANVHKATLNLNETQPHGCPEDSPRPLFPPPGGGRPSAAGRLVLPDLDPGRLPRVLGEEHVDGVSTVQLEERDVLPVWGGVAHKWEGLRGASDEGGE